ncbi:MAG: fructose-bisphosphate aldolase, class II [Parcubacteria group bacterium Athens1014_10]|nr:MAG: fructose-bisphosphate aldolase, class II [Parcubacteria group bacterium Athens1014_10]TSD04994.1 MAG: fructose-bisphosphate aldolase, class II [Parcubacteria group bacterium Athens0714_12]
MLIGIDVLLKKARKEGYAVGAFDVYNLETALGLANAAIKKKSPIIMMVSETTIQYAGIKPITHIVSTIAKNLAVGVPVALHLDHGRNFESVSECIKAGFTSVHIDASNLPFDENIAITKQAALFAHKNNIWIQGELGPIAGEHTVGKEYKGELPKTNPDLVKKFIEETGIDMLAIAVGPTHGMYINERIDFKLLKKIRKMTNIPLVLHGSSGVPDDEIKEAVKIGVSKINVGTAIRFAFSEALRKTVKESPKDLIDVRKLLTPSIEAVQKVVEEKIELFGSANKG